MFSKQIKRNMEVYVDNMLVKKREKENHLDDLKETFGTFRQYIMKLKPAKCAFRVSSGKFLSFMVSQRGIETNPEKVKAILEMSSPKTIEEVHHSWEGWQPSTSSSLRRWINAFLSLKP